MTRSKGFTLLELLAALVAFSLLLTGLSQLVHYGLQARQLQMRIAGGQRDLAAVDGALRQMIKVMDPGDSVDPAPIAATAGRLDFVTFLPDASGLLTVRQVKATILADSEHRLVLRWQPYVHAQRPQPASSLMTTVLSSGVARVEFSFWRPSGGWVSVWTGPNLPSLVRVHLEFVTGDPRHWPDLVAAPGLDPP